MKKSGFLLITVAFLGGSLVSVIHATEVKWSYFGIAFALGVLGVILARLGSHRMSRDKDKLSSNIQDIVDSLERIVKNTTQLNADKLTIFTYDMRHRIDELVAADIIIFADARESLKALYGLGTFAEVMGHFATGERYLNRVWSASADGYIDEVNAYIEKSQSQFRQALDIIRKVRRPTAA